jgi:hypothetical protein
MAEKTQRMPFLATFFGIDAVVPLELVARLWQDGYRKPGHGHFLEIFTCACRPAVRRFRELPPSVDGGRVGLGADAPHDEITPLAALFIVGAELD